MALHYTQPSYLIAAQTVRDAISEDDEGDTKIAYCKYLSSILFMVQSLKDDAWNKQDMKSLSNETSKLLKLTQKCLGRVIDIFDATQTQKENENQTSESNNEKKSQTYNKVDTSMATSSSLISNTSSKNFNDLVWSSLPAPPSFSSNSSSQNDPNHSMFEAYQRRKTLNFKNSKQKSDATTYNLSLFRQAAEKMALSQAKEKALKEKIAEQVIAMKAEAERRCNKLQQRSNSDKAFRQSLLTEILAFEHEAQWPLKFRDAVFLNKDDHAAIGKILKLIIMRKDHPLGRALVNLQTSIYNQIHSFVNEEYFPADVKPYSSSHSHCSPSDSEIIQQVNFQSLSLSNKIPNSSSVIKNASNTSENPFFTEKTSKDFQVQGNQYSISFENEFEELENSMFSDSDSEMNENEKYDILTFNASKLLDKKNKVDPTDLQNEFNNTISNEQKIEDFKTGNKKKSSVRSFISTDNREDRQNDYLQNEYSYTMLNKQVIEDFKTDDEKISSIENYSNHAVWENGQSENPYSILEPNNTISNDQDGETKIIYESNIDIYEELIETVSTDSYDAKKNNDNEYHIYESIPINLDSTNNDSNAIVDCIYTSLKPNEADEYSADAVVTKEFENIVHEILFGIDRLYSVLLLTYETLDTPLGRDQAYATFESVLFEPLWQWVIKLFRKVNSKKEVKLESLMKKYAECKPKDMMIREKFTLPNSSNPPYQEAIDELKLLVGMTSPLEKLECAVRTMKAVCDCVEKYYLAQSLTPPLVGSDDLVPVTSYIILKTELPQIVSECHAMLEFIHEGYLLGEEGYCLTTLQTGVSNLLRVH